MTVTLSICAERCEILVSNMLGIENDHRSKAAVADFVMDVLESLRASVVGCAPRQG